MVSGHIFFFHLIIQIILITNIYNIKTNLITNENFKKNSCWTDYCVWIQFFYKNEVNDWLPFPRIEIGRGDIYSSSLTINDKVIVLRDDKCVKKIIPRLEGGEVQLDMKWTVKKGMLYSLSYLKIYANGKLLNTWVPPSQSIHNSNMSFNISGGCQILQLQFCGSNIILVEVKLFGYAINSNVFDIPIENLNGFGNPFTTINIFTSNCIRKKYILKQGYHVLKFKTRVVYLFCGLKSHLIVYWNDQIIKIHQPIDQSTNSLSFQIKGINGVNQLKFCASLCVQQKVHHQIIIDNNNDVTEHFYLSKKYDNLIKNGDFQQSICPSIICNYLQKNFNPLTFPYWYPQDSLQILKVGNLVYSLPDTNVIDLDADENTCARTYFNISSIGKYVLQFGWMSRNNDYASMQFFWQIDGQKLQYKKPNDLFFNHQVYYFQQILTNQNVSLIICGAGTSDRFGVIVDNFRVFYVGTI